jgi:outer membrane protein assembly factor BamB
MRCVPLVLALTSICAPALAGEWPGWRGPRGDGHSDEPNIPTRWGPTENIAWKVPIPGKGHSSPVVWGDRIFLTTALEKERQRVLLCLDRRSGRELWRRVVVTSALEQKHDLNSYASATPVTDGKHLWVSFFEQPKIVLACFDLEGNEEWRVSPGTFSSMHGFCSSPVLYKDTVILNGDQDADAYLVAFEKETGKERWRTDRPNKTRSYCTPIFFEHQGHPQMALSGSKSVCSYDPDTGKPIWWMAGPTEQFVATLVYTDGILFVTGGFPDFHVLGVDPGGSGDVLNTHIKWRDRRGASYVPSPIAADGHFFIASDNGIGSCFEAKTGRVKWKERLGRRHSASAIAAGGNAYFLDDDGETFVIKASPEYELVSQNSLGEAAFASPAISRGQLFIRTAKHLWCIGQTAQARVSLPPAPSRSTGRRSR